MAQATVKERLQMLRDDILSEIDGGEECKWRDSMLTDWAFRLEVAIKKLETGA